MNRRASGVIEYQTVVIDEIVYANQKAVLLFLSKSQEEKWVPISNLSINSQQEIEPFEHHQAINSIEIAKWFCEQEGII